MKGKGTPEKVENMQHYARFEAIGARHMKVIV